MKTRTTVLALILALLSPFVVNAQEESAPSIWDKLKNLREEHKVLKEQVEAGTITKVEARKSWKLKIDAVRAEKEKFYENKMKNFRKRYEKIAEKNPERSEKLKARFDKRLSERGKRQANRKALMDKVISGEVSKQEAREVIQGKRADGKVKRAAAKAKKSDMQMKRKDRKAGTAAQ